MTLLNHHPPSLPPSSSHSSQPSLPSETLLNNHPPSLPPSSSSHSSPPSLLPPPPPPPPSSSSLLPPPPTPFREREGGREGGRVLSSNSPSPGSHTNPSFVAQRPTSASFASPSPSLPPSFLLSLPPPSTPSPGSHTNPSAVAPRPSSATFASPSPSSNSLHNPSSPLLLLPWRHFLESRLRLVSSAYSSHVPLRFQRRWEGPNPQSLR